MSNRIYSKSGDGVEIAGGCGCMVFVIAICLLCVSWTDRNLDFWATMIKGEVVDVPFWLSFAAALLGPFNLAFNVISELARLVI